jgi:DNA-binding transcriptional ArsR family regulator
MTLTELSRELNLPKSTIHDNLLVLIDADLVKSKRGSKWVYYELTYKGRILVDPKEQEKVRILVLLSFSSVCIIVGVFEVYKFLRVVTTPSPPGVAYGPPDVTPLIIGETLVTIGLYSFIKFWKLRKLLKLASNIKL